jgi:hypothetical protein
MALLSEYDEILLGKELHLGGMGDGVHRPNKMAVLAMRNAN